MSPSETAAPSTPIPRISSQGSAETVPVETPPNAFPCFLDGDVFILSGYGKTWKLHSTLLRQSSGIFARLLHDPALRKKSKKNDAGDTIKYKLNMVPYPQDPSHILFRSFERADLNPRKQPFSFENFAGLGSGEFPPFLSIYDNLFRLVYNMEPILPDLDETTLSQARVFSIATLSQCATNLQAMQSVRLNIESCFLQLGQQMWRRIAQQPEFWAHMGIHIQSAFIYREAMCHLVGATDLKGGINLVKLEDPRSSASISRVLEQKKSELLKQKLIVERRLLDFYPQDMLHHTIKGVVPNRAAYSNDIYLWQALTLVRQFISSCYLSNRHHRAEDGGVEFYRKIGAGGDAYIDEAALQEFDKSFNMSGKAQKVLTLAMEYVKNELKVVVQDLLVDRTNINRSAHEGKAPYLTCTSFSDAELPWYRGENVTAAYKLSGDTQLHIDAMSMESGPSSRGTVKDMVNE